MVKKDVVKEVAKDPVKNTGVKAKPEKREGAKKWKSKKEDAAPKDGASERKYFN